MIDANLDLTGVTADAMDYGYLLLPSTVPNDLPRTVTLPTSGAEFDKIGVKIFSRYYSSITVSAADSANIQNIDGSLSTSYVIPANEFVVMFWDNDLSAWVVTDNPVLDLARIQKTLRINASIDLQDFYTNSRVASQVSSYDIPSTIVNTGPGSIVTLFDKDNPDPFLLQSKLAIYNPSDVTMSVAGYSGQTIVNDIEGTTPTTIDIPPHSYAIFNFELTVGYHLVDTSNVRYTATEDNTTTGSDQDITPTLYNILYFTEGFASFNQVI